MPAWAFLPVGLLIAHNVNIIVVNFVLTLKFTFHYKFDVSIKAGKVSTLDFALKIDANATRQSERRKCSLIASSDE